MGSLYEKCVEQAKKNIPDFDENNPEHIDLMIKGFVLSAKNHQEGQFIYDSYLKDLIEDRERATLNKMLSDGKFDRNKLLTARMETLQLEKEIVEHKMKVLREFMD